MQGEHRGVRGCVQFHHRLGEKVIGTHLSLIGFGFEGIDLHWEGPVDEVRWLVVDVLHLDDHPLVVRVCGG